MTEPSCALKVLFYKTIQKYILYTEQKCFLSVTVMLLCFKLKQLIKLIYLWGLEKKCASTVSAKPGQLIHCYWRCCIKSFISSHVHPTTSTSILRVQVPQGRRGIIIITPSLCSFRCMATGGDGFTACMLNICWPPPAGDNFFFPFSINLFHHISNHSFHLL